MAEDDINPDLPAIITMGDPAGIGPEITLKAHSTYRERKTPFPFVMAADPEYIASLSEWPISILETIEDFDIDDARLSVIPVRLASKVHPGQGDASHGQAIIDSIKTAVNLVQQRKACAIVTNPINKEILYQTGFSFPGHTEFLADLCNVSHPVMMLSGGGLRVVPITIHIPLLQVSEMLTHELIVQNARVLNKDLREKFNIEHPRIAVAGLNPHAGEKGTIGREELDVIIPSVDALRSEGMDIQGPFPADTLFHEQARSKYDAVLCMYHDQALIPLKTIDFDGGVNVTLGLPIIRTSPDHGTAYDIAGKNIASPRSLSAAMDMALQMARKNVA